tara:strand:- start:86 stop:511 length:426 start_codon:yes stop_codon:yes gene_type:complete
MELSMLDLKKQIADCQKLITLKKIKRTRAKNIAYERQSTRLLEGLGSDYRDSEWLMPSIAKALQHRSMSMFANGQAPLFRTGEQDLVSFGSGIFLYLKFLKALSICFTAMTVLSLPAYFFATAGSKIPVEDLDAFGFGTIR